MPRAGLGSPLWQQMGWEEQASVSCTAGVFRVLLVPIWFLHMQTYWSATKESRCDLWFSHWRKEIELFFILSTCMWNRPEGPVRLQIPNQWVGTCQLGLSNRLLGDAHALNHVHTPCNRALRHPHSTRSFRESADHKIRTLSWIIQVGPVWSQGFIKIEDRISHTDVTLEEWSQSSGVAGLEDEVGARCGIHTASQSQKKQGKSFCLFWTFKKRNEALLMFWF